MKIKSLLVAAVLITAIFGFAGFAGAQTADNSALIAQLQDRIQQLLQQIAMLQAQQGGAGQPWCHTFSTYLMVSSAGTEVDNLWTALGKDDPSVADSLSLDHAGMGQLSIFGENTAAAVVAFQGKYGIRQTGTVGPLTRAKLNSLYGCGVNPARQCVTSADCPQMSCAPFPLGCPTGGFACISGKCVFQNSKTCTPNWICTWGPCINGSQSQTQKDLNNCGITTNVPSCPALAQTCNPSTAQCGKLIYFCSDNSPYCKPPFSPVIDQYTQISGCVQVTKHIIPDFAQLPNDPLAVKYNVTGVPAYIFEPVPGKACFADIGKGGGTKVENITNGVNNFSCSQTPAQSFGCGNDISTVWYSGSSEIQRSPYFFTGDACDGYRCLTGRQMSPSCYSANECSDACSGQCINISVAKNYCQIAPTQPSITVTSPNGGETVLLGTSGAVNDFRTTWTSSNLSGNVSVYLNFADGGTCLLGTVPVSQGYFLTTLGSNYKCSNIPSSITSGQYKVFLNTDTATTDPNSLLGIHDFSDNYFTITTQSVRPLITIISPNGGETWKIGETHNITWNPGLAYNIGCHNLISLQDTAGKNAGIISDGFLAQGQTSLSWNTKDMYSLSCGSGAQSLTVAPGTYRIAVIEQGDGSAFMPDINAYSNYFSIVAPTVSSGGGGGGTTPPTPVIPPVSTPPVSGAPSVTVASPNGGETWTQGQTYNIAWTPVNENRPLSIYLFKYITTSSGLSWSQYLITNDVLPAAGSYAWKVPSDGTIAAASTYKIVISDGSNNFKSANYFSIVSAQ